LESVQQGYTAEHQGSRGATMKVYDVWVNDKEEEGEWITTYGESLDDVALYTEMDYPECDWIIIENDLPF